MTTIKVIKVTQETSPKGYEMTSVAYSVPDGSTKGMKIFPFHEQKEVARAFDNSESGDLFEVEFQKNAKGFWEFAPVPRKLGKEKEGSKTPTNAPALPARGNWETSVERAARQVMIVRQSSISSAVEHLKGLGIQATPEDVLKVAKQFEDFVMSSSTAEGC